MDVPQVRGCAARAVSSRPRAVPAAGQPARNSTVLFRRGAAHRRPGGWAPDNPRTSARDSRRCRIAAMESGSRSPGRSELQCRAMWLPRTQRVLAPARTMHRPLRLLVRPFPLAFLLLWVANVLEPTAWGQAARKTTKSKGKCRVRRAVHDENAPGIQQLAAAAHIRPEQRHILLGELF